MVAQVLHNNQTQWFANSSVPVFFYSDNPQADIAEGEAAGISSESQYLNKGQGNKGYKDSKEKTHRCAVCRKRVGLTAIKCRYGGLYCGIHRYSDKHDCSFDYRELGAQEIRRNNPRVVSEKIKKI
ncbi:AN1-type zinc finger protein 6 [Homalodisca vitripennis]|nr:AN1-type zinc finger protein 6 [Homalodisca vitripennis]